MTASEEYKASSAAYAEKLLGLLRRAQAGDAAAAQRLFDEFAPHFRLLIRIKLAPRLRNLFDSNDFLVHPS